MLINPIHPNIVQIPAVESGCCTVEFDSTYPIQLNGIINPDEFQQSITNINQSTSSIAKYIGIVSVIGALAIVSGMVIFIVGGMTAVKSHSSGFPPLVGVGCGIFFLGMIICAIGTWIIYSRITIRLQKAISKESRKYSTRSPTPCTWRLDTRRVITDGYGNYQTAIVYHIMIEIGGPIHPPNTTVSHQYSQGFDRPTSFPPQSNHVLPPPPYNSYVSSECCPQCGRPRENPMTKFCLSCEQPFYI